MWQVDGPRLTQWLQQNPLAPAEVDCATAVMLKILDGKCKMKMEEKIVMAHLYRAVKELPGLYLGSDMHQLIAPLLDSDPLSLDESVKWQVYEHRVLAETRISRPVMKAFKARIRQADIFSVLCKLRESTEFEMADPEAAGVVA